MKKFLTVIICIALIAGIIFCVNSCRSENDIVSDPTPEGTGEITQDTPDTESDAQPETEKPDTASSTVYTGTGIYHGKVDSSFIEVTIDSINTITTSCRLAPELAEKFSSLNLEPESIITFEYQLIDDQYVIKKIN